MYSTLDYLSDEYWIIDKILSAARQLLPKITIIFLRKKLKFYSINYSLFIKRFLKNLPYGLTIIYLGIFAVSLLAIYSEKSQGLRVITLSSGSMEPVIPVPSLVATLPAGVYKKGDIITYKEKSAKTNLTFNHTITHRIIDEKVSNDSTFFITQGDANSVPDLQNVAYEDILGKVVIIIPYLGYFPLLLKTLPGFFILIAMPAYVLVKNELKYLIKEFGYDEV